MSQKINPARPLRFFIFLALFMIFLFLAVRACTTQTKQIDFIPLGEKSLEKKPGDELAAAKASAQKEDEAKSQKNDLKLSDLETQGKKSQPVSKKEAPKKPESPKVAELKKAMDSQKEKVKSKVVASTKLSDSKANSKKEAAKSRASKVKKTLAKSSKATVKLGELGLTGTEYELDRASLAKIKSFLNLKKNLHRVEIQAYRKNRLKGPSLLVRSEAIKEALLKAGLSKKVKIEVRSKLETSSLFGKLKFY